MRAGDRVALLSESRPEWLVADFAILTAGAVTVPIYPTLSAEQVGFILRDSGASLAIVSNATQLAKVIAMAPTLPALRDRRAHRGHRPGAGDHPVHAGARGPRSVDRGHRRMLDGWGVGRAFHDAAKRVRPEDLATDHLHLGHDRASRRA